MSFRGFYHWIIEFDPPDDQKAQEGLRRVLELLSEDGQLPPHPHSSEEHKAKQETHKPRGGTN